MKRKMAHIVSGKVASSVCPNCATRLDGVTAANFSEFFETNPPQLEGHPTLCCYCGALLIFADNQGHVRAMTEAERNSVRLAPIVERLYDFYRKRAQPPDFTKKRWN